jgi:hypothetical protein
VPTARRQRDSDEEPRSRGRVGDQLHGEPIADGVDVTLTASEVRALPAVVDVVTAGEILGIGRSVAYELVRTERFPTPVLRIGRQIKIPTAYLIDLLGLSTGEQARLPRQPDAG